MQISKINFIPMKALSLTGTYCYFSLLNRHGVSKIYKPEKSGFLFFGFFPDLNCMVQ